jgi:hypothetical protein
MSQLDDLKASLEASDAKLVEIADKVNIVQDEVQTLIDRLGSPNPPDLTEVLALAMSIQGKTNAVAEDLDTTPKDPST